MCIFGIDCHNRRRLGFAGLSATGPVFRRAAAVALVLIAATFGMSRATDAEAASKICRDLQSRYAVMQSSGGKRTGGSDKYIRAIKAQKIQIGKAEAQLRRRGCTGLKAIFGSSNKKTCNSIRGSLDKMHANLGKLQSRVGSSTSSSGASKAQLRRVRLALRRNGCDNNQVASGRRSITEQVFGTKKRTVSLRTLQASRSDNGSRITIRRRGGTFKTLCVRTCDGYYFPISFSTTQNLFERDSETCDAMCPGTKTELFYHPASDQDPEDMISHWTGEPYSNLPTAFDYRTRVDPTCRCNFKQAARNFEIVAGQEKVSAEEASESVAVVRIPLPTPRPDPFEDHETLANRAGHFRPTHEPETTAGTKLAATGDGKKRVRIVGEAFFPVE
jgi:hypothetical protein